MIRKRILQYIDSKQISKYKFYKDLGLSNGFLDKEGSVRSDICEKISYQYEDLSLVWLLTGQGEMIKKGMEEKNLKHENLIPFYDNVESIGGNHYVAEMSPVSSTTDYIDAGDWFPGVSAAIRHYNDSMIEYPTGCILALKEITDVKSIIWGSNYVIETIEQRITKRLQTSDDPDYIKAYSSNMVTYPDGKLIHEPLDILKTDIKRMFLVLGRIVKEHSSGPVYTTKPPNMY